MGIGQARIGPQIIGQRASPQPATSETILSAATAAAIATAERQARLAAYNLAGSRKPRAIGDRRAWAEGTIASRRAVAARAAGNPDAQVAAVAAVAAGVAARVTAVKRH